MSHKLYARPPSLSLAAVGRPLFFAPLPMNFFLPVRSYPSTLSFLQRAAELITVTVSERSKFRPPRPLQYVAANCGLATYFEAPDPKIEKKRSLSRERKDMAREKLMRTFTIMYRMYVLYLSIRAGI